MKTENLLLIGGACLIGYYLWKQSQGGVNWPDNFGGIGFGETGNDGPHLLPSLLPPGVPPPMGTGGGDTGGASRSAQAAAVVGSLISASGQPAAQSWQGVTYGQPGQPSVTFLQNTIAESRAPGASQATKNAAAAAYAGAPPRVVAKIKAGKIF